MPEGHTLHRLARAQRARFAGQLIEVTSPQGRFAGAELVDGRVLDDVTAHGKHVFAAFGDRIVHVHLGLFGKYAIGEGDPPEPRGAVRMRWVADTGWADLRGPTACDVLEPVGGRRHRRPARSGPASCGSRRRAGVRRRIVRSRAPIAGLLMDQAVLSGVGNVYRAEILYRHRLDPYLAGRHLDASRWQALWKDLVVLMRAGLRSGRIVTTEPGDRTRPRDGCVAEDAHYVYRRTDLPCRVRDPDLDAGP